VKRRGEIFIKNPADFGCELKAGNNRVDRILINNVGFFEVKPFIELTDEDWHSMFELNVMSGVRLSRALLPPMLKRNNGRIVFISSEQAFKPNPGMLHYAVSKTAQVSVARGLAELTKGFNVTVNSVIVAPTWTEEIEGEQKKSRGDFDNS